MDLSQEQCEQVAKRVEEIWRLQLVNVVSVITDTGGCACANCMIKGLIAAGYMQALKDQQAAAAAAPEVEELKRMAGL